MQAGELVDGKLAVPRPGTSPLALSIDREYGLGGGCNAPADLARFGVLGESTAYLANPYAYTPHVVRVVVDGQLRPGATDAVLLGAGAPRHLRVDANQAFMAVLSGRYWHVRLRVVATFAGKRMKPHAVQSLPKPEVPESPEARAPDPDGGAPWGFAAGAHQASAYGRIVGGWFASIEPQFGALHAGPQGWASGGEGRLPRKRPPVFFDAQGGPEDDLLGQPTGAMSRPQIERRTLPGRTIITGVANPDVTSVTITTPRDVRTLRPSGPKHVLIAVYDGQFFGGSIVAAVQLRDGRTLTEPILNGPGGEYGAVAHTTPSLQESLQGVRRQIARERRHPPHYPRFAPKPPNLATIARVIEGRITYEHAHPGVLPGT
jgi:hypothetical protein